MNFYVYLPFFCLYVNKHVCVCVFNCWRERIRCFFFCNASFLVGIIVLKEAFDACVKLLSSSSDFHTLLPPPPNPTHSLWFSRIHRFRLNTNKNVHVVCVCVGFTALDLIALCLMDASPPTRTIAEPKRRDASWAEPSNVGNDNTLTFSRSLIFILTHTHTHTL